MSYELLLRAIDDDVTPRRAAERATVLAILADRFGPTVTLDHLPTGAPVLVGAPLNISISHSRNTAAIALSETPIGVDIETWRDQLLRVRHKFLTSDEMLWAGDNHQRLLMAWTAKEAAYKLALTPELALTSIPLLHILGEQRATTDPTFLDMQVTFPKSTACEAIAVALRVNNA